MNSTDFVWGTSTSAFQIEGGRYEGGKGESIWDRFADDGHMPESGDVACDHYHRWREDVALMADLGVTAYRFSTAWTRIIPDGLGEVNEAGLSFYSDLIDELIANGITPWLTLYHWDLPQVLQDRGGWENRDVVDAFVRYADVASRAFGDRVQNWITHNEPFVAAYLGYGHGVFAPGIADFGSALTVGHHLLLSHGRAARVIRSNVPNARVGISLDCTPSRPATNDPADIAASRMHDGFRNRWFFDPVFGKGYPDDIVEVIESRAVFGNDGLPFIQPKDLEDIAAPIDFLGINYYSSADVSVDDPQGRKSNRDPGPEQPAGFTEMGWCITPQALEDYLVHIAEEYEPASLVITENGASYSTSPDADGVVADQRRIDYIASHIDAVAAARRRGAPVDGYFVWSLLDNLEWDSGYGQRFGIVWVDHSTGERTPKESYRWYKARIAAGL